MEKLNYGTMVKYVTCQSCSEKIPTPAAKKFRGKWYCPTDYSYQIACNNSKHIERNYQRFHDLMQRQE